MKQLKHLWMLLAAMLLSINVWGAAPTWDLCSITDLTSTDVFVIVDANTGKAMTNNNGTSAAPAATAVTVSQDGNTITGVTDVMKWNISGNASGYTFYPNGDTKNWLYATATNNGLRVGTNTNKTFVIANHTNGEPFLKHSGTNRYIGVYNSQDWRCYTSVNTNINTTKTRFYKYTVVLDPSAVAMVVLPSACEFVGSKSIELSCETEGASIYYTLDGNDPTTSSALYSGAITITETTTVKAIAVKDGMTNSDIASATYTKAPEFASLAELVAADLTSGAIVKVSFENVAIKSILVTSGYRNGIYFDIQKDNKDIEIYYQDVPNDWVVGGTVSGTMTCEWKNYKGTWELAPAQGSWDWNNLTYSDPTQGGTPEYASLAELVAAGTPSTSGSLVTVTLTDEAITSFFVSQAGKRQGVFLLSGSQAVEIYCGAVEYPDTWEIGGTLSGTLTCTWKLYGSTWELVPANWEDLTYTAPTAPVIVPEYVSLAELVAAGEPTAAGKMVKVTLDKEAIVNVVNHGVFLKYTDERDIELYHATENPPFEWAVKDSLSAVLLEGNWILHNNIWELIITDWSALTHTLYVEPTHTYAITIAEGIENGTVTVEGGLTEAEAGVEISLNVEAAEGYELETLTVMAGETPVTVSEDYKFTMPAAAVTVNAVFTATTGGDVTGDIVLTFVESGTSSDLSGVYASVAAAFGEDAEAIVSAVSVSKVYAARTGRGAKFGTSSATGSIAITLKQAVNVSKIIVEAAGYSDTDKGALSINGTEYATTVRAADGFETFTKEYATPEALSTITIASAYAAGYRIYVKTITLVLSTGDEKTITNIAVKTAPTTVVYTEGQKFDPSGLVITATYDDESTADVAYADASYLFHFDPSPSASLSVANTKVTISYGGKSVDQAITVNAIPTYAIAVAEGIENGAVAIEGDLTEAEENDVITLIATPSFGYEFEAWDVKDADETAITVTDNKFTMPAKAVTIAATFKVIPPVIVELPHTGEFNGKAGQYTAGWLTNGTGKSRTDCVVIGKDEILTSPQMDLSSFSEVSITFTGRRYGSLSGSKATVNAAIVGGSSVGTIDFTENNVGEVDGEIKFTPTTDMTAVKLVFTCTNANNPGSSHGAGIGSITITGRQNGAPKFALGIAENIENGTVAIEGDLTEAEENEVITLTATPAEGYEFEAWAVKDADEAAITVTDNKFTMPAKAVTVSATFKLIPVKYGITAATCENGSVAANVTEAVEGAEITLTATPAVGYMLEAWNVKGVDETPITVTDNKFNMPAQAVTVSATFKAVVVEEFPYTATFNGKNENYSNGWTTTGTGKTRTDCIVIGKDENITSPTIDFSGYDLIELSFTGRRFGSLSGSKATVNVALDGVSMGTIDITNGSVDAVAGSIVFEVPASITDPKLVFTCTNATSAGSTHGAGIGSITINGYKSEAVRSGLTPGKMGTICVEKKTLAPAGAKFYTLDKYDPAAQILTVTEHNDYLEAGVPYIFEAEAAAIDGVMMGEVESAKSSNGLYAVLSDFTVDTDNSGIYGIVGNEVRPAAAGATFKAGRCYIKLDEVSTIGSGAPARAFRVVTGTNTTTGMESLELIEGATKMLYNGQVVILRDGKCFDVTGRLVK